MSLTNTRTVRRGASSAADPHAAVAELAAEIEQEQTAGVIFFCSDAYDPLDLAEALNARFSCPVVGCTSAGEIGEHYTTGGIVGISFGQEDFRLHPVVISDLLALDSEGAQSLAQDLHGRLEMASGLDSREIFALALLDGLSVQEESVTAFLSAALEDVPLIGGSAGDNLHFKETRVFAEGRFHTGAGVLTLVETRLPFRTFQLQHFEPSEKDLVITEADPAIRRVTEIDGGPAAEEYAALLGMEIDDLAPQIFSRYPLMLQIGDEWYVRSIQKVNPDGSLDFFCAIEEGLPLTIARGVGFVETLQAKADELRAELGEIQCTLGCDCILRRLEIQETGLTGAVEEVLAPLNFTGFSTFGEQFGAIHVNQTLTGVALGTR